MHSAFTFPAVAVMTAVPALTAVTVPSAATFTTASLLEDHTILSVVSAGVTVAFKVKDLPVSTFWLVAFRVTFVAGTGTGVTVRVLFVLLILNTRSYQVLFFTEWNEKVTSFSR